MEFVQPGGSVKDRAARRIIEVAIEKHELTPGQPVVEMTSGNMGAGLAIVCGILRHPFIATMSEGNSPQRASMLRGLGAEVVLVPQVTGIPGNVTGEDIEAAAQAARDIAAERGAYFVNQFHALEGVKAHQLGTGPEILTALDNEVSAFVSVVGSGGTFVGSSRALKQANPEILCYAVEPEGTEVLAGKSITKPRHILQGIGYGIVPPLWEPKLPDGFLAVSDDEARHMQSLLAAREGLFVGYSSAANVVAAVKLASSGKVPPLGNVVTVLCDTGLKYSF